MYTGDSCEGLWSLPPQTKNPRYGSACVVHNQLQSGQMNTTTVMGTIKDSGVIDISFKAEGKEEDNYAKFAVQNENCQDIDYNLQIRKP